MKNLKYIILSALIAFGYSNVSAQGVKVYVKDKAPIEISYAELDSIVAYESNEVEEDVEFVDLGLSVNWAKCNLGAKTPEAFGDYYAWGEIETKEAYNWGNGLLMGKKIEDFSGNPEYDAATAKLGAPVRIPTDVEVKELIENCTMTWTTQNDVNGCLVVSNKNGNSIFLPAAGYMNDTIPTNIGTWGNYWTSTPRDIDNNSSACMYFIDDPFEFDCWWTFRMSGYPIRPVKDK